MKLPELFRSITAYDEAFQRAAAVEFQEGDAFAIPWWIRLKAQATIESGLNPAALNRRSGALGLAQFMPKTWEWVMGSDPKDRMDPGKSIKAQARYMAFLCGILKPHPPLGVWRPARLYGTDGTRWLIGLAAYNWGPGNVLQTLKAASPRKAPIEDMTQLSTLWPAETQNYVSKILQLASDAALETG